MKLLQRINLADLPLSKLSLKIGASIMLLRNLDQPAGLNNGFRMIVECMGYYIIAATLMSRDHDGEMRLILRILLISLESNLAFILTRRQFPIQLCSAITINKSQRQTLQIAGLDLWVPIFIHEQLYMVLSCATNISNLTVLLPETAEGKTANIVYLKVLEHMREDLEIASFMAELYADGNWVDN